MSDLERNIANAVNRKLTDGTIERLVESKIEEAVTKVLDETFGYCGEGRKVLQHKIDEVLVPVIEKHDFNKYLVKLDAVLTSIINETTLSDNQKILHNFKELMKEPDRPEIKLSEIFEKYCEHVAKNVNTTDLDACCIDDEPYYQDVRARMEVEYVDKTWRSSSFDDCIIKFSCDEDEELNCTIKCYKDSSKDSWRILRGVEPVQLNSLASLSDFEVFLWTIDRSFTKIIIDTDYEYCDDIEPEEKPEWSLS